ncbi:hypothetical protein BD626DRAFT_397115 [Schizophyllum amplum]|uniref:Yeast cell wall synthesis Kre9/Knh1-like N-terminal domain-containing protein n=1 Tax=Schizophyllum amplum TaxID=97359 RepID=A0A550CQ20_9AGAR|nr:hypothetical protein BD626DRAFT_397115 [Auriculariopsis ampla]
MCLSALATPSASPYARIRNPQIVSPASGTTCQAGQPCTVEWLDNGSSPQLAAIGVTRVGLYMGDLQLVQSIEPVDVSATHSMTFTPNAMAGPNSDSYYLAFVSTALTDASGSSHRAYSPFFTLAGMTGASGSPVASLTSSLAVPSTLTSDTFVSPAGTPSVSTVTVGTLSTSASPIPSLSASSASRMSTTRSATGSGASSASASASSGASSGSGDDGDDDSNGAFPARGGVSNALALSCAAVLSLYMTLSAVL